MSNFLNTAVIIFTKIMTFIGKSEEISIEMMIFLRN